MVGNVHRILRFTFYQLHHQPISLSYGSTCPSGVEAHLVCHNNKDIPTPRYPTRAPPSLQYPDLFHRPCTSMPASLAPRLASSHPTPSKISVPIYGHAFFSLCVKDARGLRLCFALAEEFVVVDSWMKTDYSSRTVWHLVSLFELRKLENQIFSQRLRIFKCNSSYIVVSKMLINSQVYNKAFAVPVLVIEMEAVKPTASVTERGRETPNQYVVLANRRKVTAA